MQQRNFYQILDIDPSSSPKTVRKSYRELALKYHPDRATYEDFLRETEIRFKQIIEAYEVLNDPESRATYDFNNGYRSPTRGKRQGCCGPGDPPDPQSVNIPVIRVVCNLTLADLYGETEKTVEYHRMRPCECSSTKAFDRENTVEQILTQCRECKCSQRCVEQVVKSIIVPPGARSGDSRLYQGEGHQPRGEMNTGDLVILFNVCEDKQFKINGDNLVVTREVSLWTALKGVKFRLSLPNGQQVDVNYTDPISPGQAIVVPNAGLPGKQTDQPNGNLIVQFNIQFPTAIDDQTMSIIRDISD